MVGIDGTAGSLTGTTHRAGVSEDNRLNVRDYTVGLGIATGSVDGWTSVHKFGLAPDFDTGDNTVTVWDGADDGGINAMTYTYSTTNDINAINSDVSTDTQVIEVQGLDANYAQVTQNVTLAGSGYVGLGSSLMRVFRMKNVGATDNAGHVYCYVSGPTTAGVPNGSIVRAMIEPLNNQTLMSIYTVPSGTNAYMNHWDASEAGASRSTNYIIDLVARPSGGVFQLKHRSSLSDAATSQFSHSFFTPEKYKEFTDIEMRARITESAITAASVSAGFELILIPK